jgi:hypothetical protein
MVYLAQMESIVVVALITTSMASLPTASISFTVTIGNNNDDDADENSAKK